MGWGWQMAKQPKYDGIRPDTKNANKGTERGRYMVEASLRETGAGRSILLDKDGRIIAGNKTFEAASDIGLPVRVVETDGTELVAVKRTDLDLDDDTGTARKLAYYDNRAAQVGLDWDAEQMLADLGAGLDLSAMFRQDELDELLADLQPKTTGDTEPQIDRAEELRQKWSTAPGQLWQLGEHRLVCGDCTDAATVARVMGGEMAQLIVTSPPYNQNLDTFKPSGMQKESPSFVNRMASSYADSMPEDEYQIWQKQLLRLWLDFVTGNASCFYNHKIRYRDKRILSPLEWLNDCGWAIRQEIIWDRGSSITLNARMFIPADERIYWLRAGDDFVFNDTAEIKAWSTVWEVGAKNDVSISAAFATEIPTRCITAASASGDIVAEPFSGSGTTIIACENLGRRCRAVEISPAYVAVALERWAQHTGKTPVLIEGAA